MTAPERIAAIVLAAGAGARFGGDKLLHDYNGKPLGAWIADALSEVPLGWRIAVCPPDAPARRDLFATRGFAIVVNKTPEAGMGASLALGAAQAISLGADAALVCLADMPQVDAAHLRRLIARAANATAVATEAGGVRVPPAIFGRALLADLAKLTGDRGAKHLLKDAAVVAAPARMLHDIDTRDDLG